MEFKESERFPELEKILTCSICNQIFLEPTTLFCQHTFCLSCLIMQSEDTSIKCPTCNKIVMLPINNNFQLRGIIDKIYDDNFFHERKELFKTKLASNLKLKQKYEIYKQYFNDLIKKILEKNGKFSVAQPNIYFN